MNKCLKIILKIENKEGLLHKISYKKSAKSLT